MYTRGACILSYLEINNPKTGTDRNVCISINILPVSSIAEVVIILANFVRFKYGVQLIIIIETFGSIQLRFS